jgi:hypothetical protein
MVRESIFLYSLHTGSTFLVVIFGVDFKGFGIWQDPRPDPTDRPQPGDPPQGCLLRSRLVRSRGGRYRMRRKDQRCRMVKRFYGTLESPPPPPWPPHIWSMGRVAVHRRGICQWVPTGVHSGRYPGTWRRKNCTHFKEKRNSTGKSFSSLPRWIPGENTKLPSYLGHTHFSGTAPSPIYPDH